MIDRNKSTLTLGRELGVQYVPLYLKYKIASIESSKSDPGAYTATDIGPLHLIIEHVSHGHHDHLHDLLTYLAGAQDCPGM